MQYDGADGRHPNAPPVAINFGPPPFPQAVRRRPVLPLLRRDGPVPALFQPLLLPPGLFRLPDRRALRAARLGHGGVPDGLGGAGRPGRRPAPDLHRLQRGERGTLGPVPAHRGFHGHGPHHPGLRDLLLTAHRLPGGPHHGDPGPREERLRPDPGLGLGQLHRRRAGVRKADRAFFRPRGRGLHSDRLHRPGADRGRRAPARKGDPKQFSRQAREFPASRCSCSWQAPS